MLAAVAVEQFLAESEQNSMTETPANEHREVAR
jgi:hypothetical protein